MNKTKYFCQLAALALFLALPLSVLAQETSSTLRVDTYESDGSPANNVAITVTDTRTGTARSGSTGDSGSVNFGGMRVGGPYTVQAASDSFGNQTVTDVFLRLGDTFLLPLAMSSSVLEEVVVTATQVQTQQLALGPSSTFGLEDLQDYPAINRDIRDVIKFDPRVYQDQAFVGALQCAGANPRFNSLTVDGVKLNDSFGLNSNGYPTQRQPFPYDSLQQVSVELAPFDVHYGGFTACNINAVTKSGENEWFGSAFYDYTSDSMRGDKLEGDKINLGDFTEERYGFSLGGPIVKDTLFFFVAYEKLEGAELFDRGPAGSGRAVEVRGVSQAQFDEIEQIIRDLYGFDPGFLPLSLPVEDEKYTIKLDWNINDDHRAALTYNWNDGFGISESDGDADELEFSQHYYERGAELEAITGVLFSDWTDVFTTEIRVSKNELDQRQESFADPGREAPGGTRFGEFRIETWNDHDNDGNFDRANVYAGIDDSRQANKLDYEVLNYKLAGAYSLDDHLLTFGYELDDLEVFNLFLQHVETENRFDEECFAGSTANGCIDQLREGRPDDVYYGNSRITNDPNDAAALWGYKTHSVYIQDEFRVGGGDWTLVAGLRFDWYESSDVPTENPNFVERTGFTNAMNFDGESLLQPRFAATWDYSDSLTFRGGVGLFSGGNPNVWLSNNYSVDGFTQVQLREWQVLEPIYGVDFSLFDIPLGADGNGSPGFDVPTDFLEAVAGGEANTGVNYLDPGFKIPSVWKVNIGTTWDFADYYQLNADILYSKAEDSALIVDGLAEVSGSAPDGRPIYDTPGTFSTDLGLTNVSGSDGRSWNLSFGLFASYDNGWDWSVGYSYTDSKEVSPMTSSVAFSNFANISVMDFNDPGRGIANYEIPHRFTWRVAYEAYWWGDNRTKFSMFGSANEGRPFSYTFAQDDGDVYGDQLDNRHLLYVPTGPSDSNVIFAETFNQDDFFAFVNASGLSKYSGKIAPRNAFNSGWWTHFDIRIEQEFPGFREDHNFVGFLVIRNFCNMINDDWCTLKEVSFPRRQAIVDMELENGQYLYEAFIPASGETRVADPSIYEMRIGLRYDF